MPVLPPYSDISAGPTDFQCITEWGCWLLSLNGVGGNWINTWAWGFDEIICTRENQSTWRNCFPSYHCIHHMERSGTESTLLRWQFPALVLQMVWEREREREKVRMVKCNLTDLSQVCVGRVAYTARDVVTLNAHILQTVGSQHCGAGGSFGIFINFFHDDVIRIQN
jgi:hypothetical protein